MAPDLHTADLDLAARAARADRAAFDTLYERLFTAAWRVAASRSSEPKDAQALTERILVRAFSQLDRYEGAVPLETWLLQVAGTVRGGVASRRIPAPRPRPRAIA